MNARRAMMKAIRIAAGDESMTDGLRVIRRFELVNGVNFDPKDSYHLAVVRNHGQFENFFRRANKILNDLKQPRHASDATH